MNDLALVAEKLGIDIANTGLRLILVLAQHTYLQVWWWKFFTWYFNTLKYSFGVKSQLLEQVWAINEQQNYSVNYGTTIIVIWVEKLLGSFI